MLPLNNVPAAVDLTGRAWLREVAAKLVEVAFVMAEEEAFRVPLMVKRLLPLIQAKLLAPAKVLVPLK